MEEEARAILRAAVSEPERPVRGLGTAINKRFHAIGGVDLELPPREPMREPPKFK